MCMCVCTQSVKSIWPLLEFFKFLILKVLFSMQQVEHHNGFIYYSKYKSSSETLTFVQPDIF